MLRGHWRLLRAPRGIKYDLPHCCRVLVVKLFHKFQCIHIFHWFPAVVTLSIAHPFYKIL